MRNLLTLKEVSCLLRKRQAGKTDTAFAKEFDVSRQFVQGIYALKWAPGPSMLRKLGVKRVTLYEVAK